ncbi:unnamed protein product, partial [Meganyctiphanes norvegica]
MENKRKSSNYRRLYSSFGSKSEFQDDEDLKNFMIRTYSEVMAEAVGSNTAIVAARGRITYPIFFNTKNLFFDIFDFFCPANRQKFIFLEKNYENCLLTLKYILKMLNFINGFLFYYKRRKKSYSAFLYRFGEKPFDFDMRKLFKHHLVAYLIVDEMHEEHPKLTQDKFWDEGIPHELPYTKAAEEFIIEVPQGSTSDIFVSENNMEILPTCPEEPEDEEFTPGQSRSFKRLVSTTIKRGLTRKTVRRRSSARPNSGRLNSTSTCSHCSNCSNCGNQSQFLQDDLMGKIISGSNDEETQLDTPTKAAIAGFGGRSISHIEEPSETTTAALPDTEREIKNQGETKPPT